MAAYAGAQPTCATESGATWIMDSITWLRRLSKRLRLRVYERFALHLAADRDTTGGGRAA